MGGGAGLQIVWASNTSRGGHQRRASAGGGKLWGNISENFGILSDFRQGRV